MARYVFELEYPHLTLLNLRYASANITIKEFDDDARIEMKGSPAPEIRSLIFTIRSARNIGSGGRESFSYFFTVQAVSEGKTKRLFFIFTSIDLTSNLKRWPC